MDPKQTATVETIEPSLEVPRPAEWRVPSLTLLFHPDVARVGEEVRLVALLGGRTCRLSRLEPLFAHPGAERARPLEDPHLSRSPLVVEPWAGGVRLRPDGRSRVVVDGERLAAPRPVSVEELDLGVVLELGDRTVVLLHFLGPRRPRQAALGMVGESEAMERLRSELHRIADLSTPVLFSGESGTGKELAARALASLGSRAAGPFVAVNMAAVPSSIAASELFGHVAGAFTGATEGHPGHFAQADGGTLFLDEIGAILLDVQGMLLRALESLEIQPLGSARRRRVDVRVLAATDENLEAAVREGRFRDALRHRLTGYDVALPPLRRRRDDLGRLLVHFLRQELRALGEEGRLGELDDRKPWLPAALVAELSRQPWPGNVRQLASAARRIAVAARGGNPVDRAALEPFLREPKPAGPGADGDGPRPAGERRPSRIGEEELVAALRAGGWRIAEAARRLGISRTSLYGLLESSGRIRKAADIPTDELRLAWRECGGDVEAMAARLETSGRALRLRVRKLGIG